MAGYGYGYFQGGVPIGSLLNFDPLLNFYIVTLESGIKINTLEAPNDFIYVAENPFLTSGNAFVKTETNQLITT